MKTLTSYVCRGSADKEDAKANGFCGGGGWWREKIPEKCPYCGRDTFVTGVVHFFSLRADVQ